MKKKFEVTNMFHKTTRMRFLTTLILIFSMTTPWSLLAQSKERADYEKPEPIDQSNEALGVLNAGIQGVGNMALQAINQHGAMMSMQNYTVSTAAANFFPNCALPPENTLFPVNACIKIESDEELAQAVGVKNIGLQNIAKLNKAKTDGLQCLKDGLKYKSAEINANKNLLTNIITEYNKNLKPLIDEKNKIMTNMENAYNLLNGGGNKLEDQGRNFEKSFAGTSCSAVFSTSQFASAAGLRGLQGNLQQNVNSKGEGLLAAAQSINPEQLTTQMEARIAAIGKDIDAVGIGGYLATGGKSAKRAKQNLGGVDEILTDKLQEITTVIQSNQSYFAKVGYQLPNFDKSFAANIEDFSKETESFFKKKYIRDCTTMADETGLGLSNEQILSSLKIPEGGNLQVVQADLKIALESDTDSMEAKLAKIADVEKKHPGTYIQINKPFLNYGNNARIPTYQLYKDLVKQCEIRYTEKGSSDPAAQSFKTQVEQAQKALSELNRSLTSFKSELASEIREEFTSCKSQGGINASTCKDPSALDSTASGFCIKTAVHCSNQVKTCATALDNMVAKKEAEIRVNADAYNKIIENLVAKQNMHLEQIKNSVLSKAEFQVRYFKGSKYTLPENLFISLPPMMKGRFGVDQRGGPDGDKKIMKDFPDQIKALQDMMDGQLGEMEQTIGEYITKQEAAISNNFNKWARLVGDGKGVGLCQQLISDYNSGKKKSQGEQYQKAMESATMAQGFCEDYAAFQTQPSCSDVNDLMTKSGQIAAHLDPSVKKNLRSFSIACYRKQGDSQEEVSKDDVISDDNNTDSLGLNEACKNFASAKDGAKDELTKKYTSVQEEIDKKVDELMRTPKGRAKVYQMLGLDEKESKKFKVDDIKKCLTGVQCSDALGGKILAGNKLETWQKEAKEATKAVTVPDAPATADFCKAQATHHTSINKALNRLTALVELVKDSDLTMTKLGENDISGPCQASTNKNRSLTLADQLKRQLDASTLPDFLLDAKIK